MKKYLLLVSLIVLLFIGWYNYRLWSSRSNVFDSRAVEISTQEDITDQNTTSQNEIISSGEMEKYNGELESAIQNMKEIEDAHLGVNNGTILTKGNFNKQDPIHRAKGEVQVKQNGDDVLISFSQDFTIPDGPDLYVVLSNGLTVKEIKKLDNLQLGPLVRKKGPQTYKVTLDERNSHSGSLSIRCRAFDTYFSVAKFE